MKLIKLQPEQSYFIFLGSMIPKMSFFTEKNTCISEIFSGNTFWIAPNLLVGTVSINVHIIWKIATLSLHFDHFVFMWQPNSCADRYGDRRQILGLVNFRIFFENFIGNQNFFPMKKWNFVSNVPKFQFFFSVCLFVNLFIVE